MSLRERLRNDLSDPEFRHAYADEHLNLTIATQIRVLRELQGLSQKELAEKLGTKQTGVSRLESADYSGWSVRILKKLAQALDLRLRISFEEFGTLWHEVDEFSREGMERRQFKDDPEFRDHPPTEMICATISAAHHGAKSAMEELMVPQHTQANNKEITPINTSPLWKKKIPAQSALSVASVGNGPNLERVYGCI